MIKSYVVVELQMFRNLRQKIMEIKEEVEKKMCEGKQHSPICVALTELYNSVEFVEEDIPAANPEVLVPIRDLGHLVVAASAHASTLQACRLRTKLQEAVAKHLEVLRGVDTSYPELNLFY